MLARDRSMCFDDPRATHASTPGCSLEGAPERTTWAFDVGGSRDNLVFGCIYRAHLPRYRLLSRGHEELVPRYFKQLAAGPDGEASANSLTSAARLRQQDGATQQDRSPFVPLAVPDVSARALGECEDDGAVDAALLERQRSLNESVRLHPCHQPAWLALAEFQEDLASGPRRGGAGRRLGVIAERKARERRRAPAAQPHASERDPRNRRAQVAVLQRALTHLPQSEELQGALLQARQCDTRRAVSGLVCLRHCKVSTVLCRGCPRRMRTS